jgi:amino acid permease
MKKVHFFEATATLIGAIVGAGILGVPYAISKVGFLPGLFLLIVLGAITLITNLMFAEVILRTKAKHQIAGYSKKYLGKFYYYFEIIAMMIGGFGAMVAYIIGEGQVLSALLGGNSFVYSLIFFAIGSVILFFGLRVIKIFEMWMVIGFITIVLLIVIISGFHVDLANLQSVSLSNIFLPYGVILFAYGGAAAIVPLREILRGSEEKIKKAVTLGTLIPIVIYSVFAFIVVGVLGANTTDVATIGLGTKIGTYMLIFGNLFAFFAMGTSFLTIGLITREFFEFDLKVPKMFSWMLVCAVPLMIFLLGSRSFIDTMTIAGSLTFTITAIVIILSFWRAKVKGDRNPEFSLSKYKLLGWTTICLFLAGTIYTLLSLFLDI